MHLGNPVGEDYFLPNATPAIFSTTSRSAFPSNINSFRRELEQIPRILLIRLRSLGDSILTLPLLDALKNWRPDLQLDILIETPYAAVFLNHPAVHETLILKAQNQPSPTGWGRLQAIWEIRKRHYSAVLNLHGGTTSLLFSILSGAKLQIGQGSHRGSRFYNLRVPDSFSVWKRRPIHTVEHQLTFMRWLEIPLPDNLSGFLYLDQSARNRVRDRLMNTGISNYFLIQPSATLYTKQWSSNNYAQLGDYLFKKHALPVIYCAAPHEAQVMLDIGKEAKERHICWADLPLDELFALIEGCRLFIGNDSGPTHAASVLRKPVVVIWGSSNFQAWHPWGTDYEAIRSDLPCMPCAGYTCKAFEEPRCIKDISFARVADACDNILRRTD